MNKNWIKFVVAGIVALACGILALVFPTLTLFVLAATGGFAIVVYKWEWMRAKQKAFSERRKVRAEARKARVKPDASGVTEADVTETGSAPATAATAATAPSNLGWIANLKLVMTVLWGTLKGVIGGAILAFILIGALWIFENYFIELTQESRTFIVWGMRVIAVICGLGGLIVGTLDGIASVEGKGKK